MATDPFGEIKKPVCGGFVEIGQSTFVELISAENCTTSPAIGRSEPNVANALRRLAFGKPCTDNLRPATASPSAGVFSPTIKRGGEQANGFSYDVRKKSKPKGSAYKKKVKSLGTAKSAVEFKGLIANTFSTDIIKAFDILPGCPEPCSDPCLPPGEDDVCAVDFCIVLDVTGSMRAQIEAVKTGIVKTINLLKSTIGNNIRLSLVLFSDSKDFYGKPTGKNAADTELFFDDKCGDQSLAAFQAAIEPVVTCWQGGVYDCLAYGGGDSPEASALAVKFAAEGGAGCWREGDVVRTIVLVTDAPNKPSLGVSVISAAQAAAACNIKVAYAGSPHIPAFESEMAGEGAIYAATTGGLNVRLGDGGTGLVSLFQTFIFSLCAKFIQAPECEGGVNLALNGTFDDNINAWNTTGTVTWDDDFETTSGSDQIGKSIRLEKGATAEQIYTNLEPGGLVLLNYNWCLRLDTGGLALAASAPASIPSSSAKMITPFISNPDEDPETGFPAVGKLGRLEGAAIVYDCTCVLTAPRFVLTAAHCVDWGYGDNQLRVDFDGTVYSSVKIYIHPLWNRSVINTDSAYDIAIIELDTDVVGVDPLGISSFSGTLGTGPEPGIGDPIKIVGFGYTGDDGGFNDESFGIKRSADQMVDEVTTQLIRYEFDITGEGAAGPGDSGGPVLFDDGGEWYISGIVSGGSHPEHTPELPTIGKLGTIVFNTRVSAFDGWIIGVLSGETQTIIGEFRDSSDTPLPFLEGSAQPSYDAIAGDCSAGRDVRSPLRARVPLDGIVKVHFELEGAAAPNTHWLNIDQVVTCILNNDDCGPGARNIVRNGNFESGVSEWTDEAGIALPPTDPGVWDNDIFAIIVNLTNESEVRQTLTGLIPGRELVLSFEVASYEPDSINELILEYGLLGAGGGPIPGTGSSGVVTNATLQPTPKRLTLTFTVPGDGVVQIYFKTGNIGGVAKIRNVLVCDLSGICEEGYDRLSFDEFATGKGSWSGGTYNPIEEDVDISISGITQVYPGLEPGSEFQLSVNVKTSGGVIITLTSGDRAEQTLSPSSPGYYTAAVIVQDSGLVVATVVRQANVSTIVDNILACVSSPEPCDGSVNEVQVLIEWNGIVRTPVNLFNAIIRYTVRDPLNPFDVTEVTFVANSEGRLSIAACDLWKSQITSGNLLGNGLANVGEIDTGDFKSVVSKTDWLWSIPQNNTSGVQDNLIINFPDPGPGNLIESIKVLLLANNMIPVIGTNTPAIHPAPLGCDTDPAAEFDIILRFVNSQELNREFSTTITKSNLWVQETDFSVGNPWDTDSATGNGFKGSSARWESAQFNLDLVDGRGLDQCTTSLFFRGEGVGNLGFREFSLGGAGTFIDSCLSEIQVENLSGGSSANEIQSIILPRPTGGLWDLSIIRFGVTNTTTLAWNTTAEQIRLRLGAFSNVGGKENILVTGTGTDADPFLVEFVNDLGATDLNMMVVSGDALTGSAPAYVKTETNGTPNERITISNPTDGRQDLIVIFGGETSVPIPYNSTLNEVSSAIEGMLSIGAGSVEVTGNVTNRDVKYAGPYRVMFVGDLGNQNVPLMNVEPAHYTVVTDWNGGPGGGKNETQSLNIAANSGTFTIRVFNIDPLDFADTAPIAFDADADAVKAAIVLAADFIEATDINVIASVDVSTGTYTWEIVFVGVFQRMNMPQIQLNSAGLVGTDVTVAEVQAGFGEIDRQRVTILRASGGSFKLTVTIGGVDYQTTAIPWNTTIEGLRAQLTALPPFEEGDIEVNDATITNAEQNLRVRITFAKKFGNVPLMIPDFQATLLCDPIILTPVDPGPYEYPIPNCDEIEDLGCQSGPLLCRPVDESVDYEKEDPCCDKDTIPDRANVSTRIKLERDLFDPGPSRTIRDLALVKGLKPSGYTPYIRDLNTGLLTETSYDVIVSTKMSILLVENELDTTNGRRRIMDHIRSHREILPTRSVWPNCNVSASIPSEVCWPGVS